MKISYHKRIDPNNGAVYSQAISITKEKYNKLANTILCEIALKYPREEEYSNTSGYAEIYLNPLRKEKNICFLNHTQTRFLNIFMKLDLKDRNTCLLIKE